MASVIEEVPITPDDSQAEAPAHEDPPAVPAKRRGRPPGSLNKKPKPSIVEVPVVAPEKKKRAAKPPPPSESEEEPPKTRKRARPRAPSSSDEEPVPPKKRAPRSAAPEPPSTQQLAAEVLQLLSNRHVGVANARRARYASWFA